MVDELGALEREYAPLKLKFDRIDILRRAIREAYDASPDDVAARIEGARFFAALGARAPQKTVDVGKLFRALGARAFLPLCSVTLKAYESVAGLAPAGVVTSAPTGVRPLKVYERVAA